MTQGLLKKSRIFLNNLLVQINFFWIILFEKKMVYHHLINKKNNPSKGNKILLKVNFLLTKFICYCGGS